MLRKAVKKLLRGTGLAESFRVPLIALSEEGDAGAVTDARFERNESELSSAAHIIDPVAHAALFADAECLATAAVSGCDHLAKTVTMAYSIPAVLE